MADDGGWPRGAGSEALASETLASGDDRARDALGELRGVLGELERRLGDREPQPMRAETVEALIQTLEALTRRVARHEAAAQGRTRELAAALSSLSQFMDAEAGAQAARESLIASRLDLVLSELAQLKAQQAAPYAEPRPIRAILAASAAAAVLSLVGVGVVAATQPDALQRVVADAALGIWQPPSS
jgi:hypothetical protein